MRLKSEIFGVEFVFSINGSGTEKVRFYRDLYGWNNISNYGKYTYVKDGILSEINYLKPAKSIIIVSIKNAKYIRDFFKKRGVDFDERVILLGETEAMKLKINFPSGWQKVYEAIKNNKSFEFFMEFV